MQKMIVITGATRGLGRALVASFVSAGHQVIGCGRNAEGIESLRAAYPQHSWKVLDVSEATLVAEWGKQIVQEYGPPDLLINNAAIMNPIAPLWEITASDFDRLIDINIKGVANCIRAFVPAMVQRGSGVIVNLSSGWGRSTSPEVAPYCASKYAIEGLSLAMAMELPRGMACIPLNPGVIDTDMLRSCWADDAQNYPSATEWAKRAASFILQLGPKDNGRSLSV